jgi:hypothetical protein
VPEDTPKRGPGRPREPDAGINRTVRIRPSTIAAVKADGRTYDQLLRTALGL